MNRFILCCSAGLLLACGADEAPSEIAPPSVAVMRVVIDSVAIEKEFVGEVLGVVDIPIRARVEGFLEGIHFSEGKKVKKGQLLYTIDAQPYEAALAEANSRLAEAEVSLVKASNDLERVEPLTEMKALSELDLDASIAQKGAAEAMVDAAKANVQLEEIRLSYATIKSPINGLIGKTQAKIGEYVGRNPNPVILNTVSRIDSVRVEFFITENDYLRFAREDRDEKDRPAKNPLTLILSDGSEYEYPGFVDFVDRSVGEGTGSLLVQSTFPNPSGLIRPGQFARIKAVIEVEENGILVPQRCVSEFQGQYFVYTVSADNKLKQQAIQVQAAYKDYYLISNGLTASDKIVFEGIQKMKGGMTIEPRDTSFTSKYLGAL